MPPQHDLTGTTIRCYRIIGRIGAGGMGEVYLARDEKLGRDVALKFLPPHLADDPDLLERFRREAQAASALSHPNVLVVHDLDQNDGRPFMITEYVEGHTLRERLKAGGVPIGELLDVAVQVAGALAAAHERGILHRDIKPENVMVRTDGYVKLLDFGLATVSASGEPGTQTRTGVVMGTPAYMSPEQARAAPLDFRSDQFSFGIVLYELATGRNPFLRASIVETAAAVVNDEPEALDRLCPQAPPPLRWTIERCLAKKPADRYASTRDLQRDLSLVRERLAEARPAALALAGSNLPGAGSTLLGRDVDVAAVLQLLARDGVRWVTLTGPGGVGKTRLAIQAASSAAPDYGGSVYFIPLASVQDFSLVPSLIAETLEIRPHTDESPLAAIKRHLRGSKPSLLLVIDNFEHVSDAAPLVIEILDCSPGVKVLATSRASLHVSAEHEYQVSPLGLPERRAGRPAEALTDAPAVALFVERARAVRPDFQLKAENATAVADICVALDGLPLAIELAAARVKALPPPALLARLGGHRLSLAGGARDLPRRQQALRSTIEWSYELLAAADQRLFRRLAVFAGGWTIEAAEAVCNAREDLEVDVFDGIESLVDKSLVRPAETRGGDARFTMLETIREYGLDRLAHAGEAAATRKAHAAYALVLAEEGASASDAASQVQWLTRCDAEHTNLRAALEYLVDARETDWAMRLANALMPFWQSRGHLPEARERFDRICSLEGASSNPELWARFGFARATILYTTGDYAGSSSAHREDVLQVYRSLADRRGIAVSLNAIGVSERALQNYAEASSRFEEALAIWRELGDHQAAARTLSNLAAVAFNEGDYARATKLYRECRAACERIGDAAGAAWAINFEASVADARGNRDAARALYAEALAAFRAIRDAWGAGDTLLAMGHMTCATDPVEAERLFREAHAVFAASGDTRGLVRVIEAFVCLAAQRRDPALALRLAGAAAAARQAIGIQLPPFERDSLERALEVVRRQTDAAGAGPWMEGWAMTPQEAIALILTGS